MTVIQIRILPTLKRLELRRQQHRLPDTPHGPSVSYRRLLLHIHTESCTWATCCRLHPGKKRDFEWGSNRVSFLLGRSRVVQTWRRCSCEWTAWMGWSLCGVRIIAVNKEVVREEGWQSESLMCTNHGCIMGNGYSIGGGAPIIP